MHFKGKTALFAFTALTGISFILISYTNRLILTPEFYKNSGDILGYDESALTRYLSVQKWIYFYQVIYLALKLSLISLVLNTTLYLSNQAINFVAVFSVVTISEFIFVIAAFGKLLWFHFYLPNGTLDDWHKTYLLSMLSLLPDVKAAWYYPLQTLNLFEVVYWFLLAYGLSRVTKLDFDNSLRVVLKGYIPVLAVWMACVLFVTLLFFPAQG